MASTRRFTAKLADALDQTKYLGVRAGSGDHRFTAIWVVVVEGRVFVRSWYEKPRSWYRTFLEDSGGAIKLGDELIPVRAVRVRSERLKDAVDRAYLAKYTTKANLKYARGFASARHRATTTELVPVPH